MNLWDYRGIFKTSKATISEVTHHESDYYTVKVKYNKEIAWAAGQHAIFTLPGSNITGTKWRAFSIASIPEEDHILLGFRTGAEPSSFKKYIIENGSDIRINVRGPIGEFKLQPNKDPIVLFASGVGITPIFSILKAVKDQSSREVNVVYASNEYYLFKNEIDAIASANPKISVTYTRHTQETQQKLSELAKRYGNTAYYYNSGTQKVVSNIKQRLSEDGINKKRMLDDLFIGY